jgi:hypothetical protein
MNEEYRLDWEDIKKAFYLKYYPPIEAYSGRYDIYNFWPHPRSSSEKYHSSLGEAE